MALSSVAGATRGPRGVADLDGRPGGKQAEAGRPARVGQLLGQSVSLSGLLGRGRLRRCHALGATDTAALTRGSGHVVLALPAQDVDSALVVDRVQDIAAARPLGRGGRAAEREEVALLLDRPVRLDLKESHAVLVLRERDQPAVAERRVLLEPMHRAPQRTGDRFAVGVEAVAGRGHLRERTLELRRLVSEHVLGAVDRELAVVELAAAGEVLLAADEHELVLAASRPARRVHELRRGP